MSAISPSDLPSVLRSASVRLTLHDAGGGRAIRWDDVGALDWSDFALVLGAGGATGLSFEAGCLLALAVDHRIRIGSARLLVGTSAGSIAATLIALGFEAADLAAVVRDLREHVDPALATMAVQFTDDLPRMPGLVHLLRRPTIGSTMTGVGMVLQRRFTAALANALRQGEFDLRPQLGFLDSVDWPQPDDRLRICATGTTTGRRRVFSGGSGVSLKDAVSASCAVPGVMHPVVIDDMAYLDGGLVSPTNADVLGQFTGGLIVVISPMSGRRSSSTIGRVSSAHAQRRLSSEVKHLRARRPVLVVEPNDALSAMVVGRAFSTEQTGTILTAAFLGGSGSLDAPMRPRRVRQGSNGRRLG